MHKGLVNNFIILWIFVALGQAVLGVSVSFPYKAKVVKVKNRGVRAELTAQSMTIKLQDLPPATIAQLRRRADADCASMVMVLKARGYYDGTITYNINSNESPALVEFKADLKSQYKFRDLTTEYVEAISNAPAPPIVKVLLKSGSPAVAAAVNEEEIRLIRQIKRKGYPFAELAERVVAIDEEVKRVDIVFKINTGVLATFGDVEIRGNKAVKTRYIRRRVTWKKGDLYDLQDVADFEQDLLVSGLFNVAKVSYKKELSSDGSLPVSVDLKERKHRTIRAGAGYRSDTGIGSIISWEHRNLFHGAESFDYTLLISEIERWNHIQFKRPDFLTRNLSLLISTESMHETPDAYTSKSYKGSILFEYKVKRHSTIKTGFAYKRSYVEQFESSEDYNLLSIPLYVERDTRDNQLDAHEGWRGIVFIEPVRDIKNDEGFIRLSTEDRGYLMLSRKRSLVLAGRVLLGSISGADRDQIPADERFYAGGGGSVRGYEYQTVGDVTDDGIPVGGLSVFEVSTEIRVRPGEKMGYVLFVDGGMAFGEKLLDASASLLWGAGVGLRYNLGFAPLRVDFAMPLNKRKGIDEGFQFYISIGQAF